MNDRIDDLKVALAAAGDDLARATRALAPKHLGGEMERYEAAVETLLAAERALADAERRPYAIPCECPLAWDVGAPLPTLLQSDETAYLFFLLDDDERKVGRLAFEGLVTTSFGAPGDETFHGHPLHGSGFEPYRAMRVVNSTWVSQLEKTNSVHRYHDPKRYALLHHFIFPFHDTTFECAARSFTAVAVERRLSDAVRDALESLF